MPLALAAYRDLLLPALVEIEKGAGRRLDLAVDYTTDSIILLCEGTSPRLLFTRKDIDDGRMREFQDRVRGMLR